MSSEVHKALQREKKEVEQHLAKIRFERDKVQPTAAAVLRRKAATRIYCHQLVCVTRRDPQRPAMTLRRMMCTTRARRLGSHGSNICSSR